MAAEPTDDLREELGGSPPAAVALLTEQEIATLSGAIAAARHRRREQLGAALDTGLKAVPPLLRRPVKKAWFG